MSEFKKVSATPKVRKFARELGANLNEIEGSERAGRVTENDVKDFIKNQINKPHVKEKEIITSDFDHSDFGEIEVINIPRVKKIAAPHLSNSWKTIPHVTHHDDIDITELENFRSNLTDSLSGEKIKITPLAFIAKALTNNLKKFPTFNSSIDDINEGKITIKKYFHIGIAVDTKHGLMVPKIRNVDKKKIKDIAKDLKEISELCQNLKINKKEFFGGSITISSLGGIGGTYFTPIINYPEVAILGIGKSYKKQLYIKDKFLIRTVLPISLSYDHRIIDGAEAAKFCNSLKEFLGENFAYKLAVG